MTFLNRTSLMLVSILLCCAACQHAPNRAKFEEEVADVAKGYPAGFIATLIAYGDRYCALMTTGQYHVDVQGAYSSKASAIAYKEFSPNFNSADRTAMSDVTINDAQKYLCPNNR
jgi:hypothetical protein